MDPKIAVIIGSTRPNRIGEQVARWVHGLAESRGDARYELVDVADFGLPLLDEPVPPSFGEPTKEHTKRWSQTISGFDAFVFVTPEYNHATSGALKNAIDYLYGPWNNKAAAFVGYGSAGGSRAIENLRLITAELQIAGVRNQVMLNLMTDFENFSTLTPAPFQEGAVTAMLDQLLPWTLAMKAVREGTLVRR